MKTKPKETMAEKVDRVSMDFINKSLLKKAMSENPKEKECNDLCHDWGNNAKNYICSHCLPTKELEKYKTIPGNFDYRDDNELWELLGAVNMLIIGHNQVVDFLSNKECRENHIYNYGKFCKCGLKGICSLENCSICTPKPECRCICHEWNAPDKKEAHEVIPMCDCRGCTPSKTKEECSCENHTQGAKECDRCWRCTPKESEKDSKELPIEIIKQDSYTKGLQDANSVDKRVLRSEILDQIINKFKEHPFTTAENYNPDMERNYVGIKELLIYLEALKKENT